jgi:hypothetical protein
MRGTSVPVWVRRSTFVIRVGGGTKADRRWLCRGTTKDAPGLREVQANRQKTRKPRAARIDVGVEVIDNALRDPTDHAVMWSLSLCGGRHLLALDFGTSPTGSPHKLGSGPTNLSRQPAEFARLRACIIAHRPLRFIVRITHCVSQSSSRMSGRRDGPCARLERPPLRLPVPTHREYGGNSPRFRVSTLSRHRWKESLRSCGYRAPRSWEGPWSS